MEEKEKEWEKEEENRKEIGLHRTENAPKRKAGHLD